MYFQNYLQKYAIFDNKNSHRIFYFKIKKLLLKYLTRFFKVLITGASILLL